MKLYSICVVHKYISITVRVPSDPHQRDGTLSKVILRVIDEKAIASLYHFSCCKNEKLDAKTFLVN